MMIPLGKKLNSSPAYPVQQEEGAMHYPSMHFVHDKAIDLPDEGTATIKFRRTMATHDTSDPKNPVHRHEIEVHGIEVHPGKKGDGMVSVADAFKKAIRGKVKEKMDSEGASDNNDPAETDEKE